MAVQSEVPSPGKLTEVHDGHWGFVWRHKSHGLDDHGHWNLFQPEKQSENKECQINGGEALQPTRSTLYVVERDATCNTIFTGTRTIPIPAKKSEA